MKKQKFKMGIRLYFVLMCMLGILGTVGISTLVAELLNLTISNLHPLLWVLILGLFIGVGASVGINQLLLMPIMRLVRAMQQVADGDFSIQLDPNTSIREMADIYSTFNMMTKALSSTEMLQSDFISNVSHEFKTPINAIEGYTMLLQGGNPTKQQLSYIDRILLNTRRLSTLVGNILLLSKVDNHNVLSNQTKFRLDEQIRQAIVLLEPQWTAKELDVDVDLEEAIWVGPENLMQHVWSNLIGNAIKFDPVGGLVRIRLSHDEAGIHFTVEDTGPGIPDDEKKAVFGRFYQADSSHKQEGNGLGLALCQQILKICHGSIQLDDSPAGGARFTVTLPYNHTLRIN